MITQDGWSRVAIAGKPADIFEPGGPVRFALLWLNSNPSGGRQPSEQTLTPLLRKHQLACASPHGDHSWWVDRVCPEFDPVLTAEQHLLKKVVPWMEERWRLPSRSIAAAGIEMGGQGAIRVGLKHPAVFRAVGSLGGAIDFHELHGRGTPLDAMYDSRERCRQDTATLHMHPSEWPAHIWFACDPADPWFRGNDRLNEKLRAYGVPHTTDLESTGPGYFDRMLEPMLEFLAAGLKCESRRLM